MPKQPKQPPSTWLSEVNVLPGDIDELGHVNNVVYLRYVQEVASAHWQHLAPAEVRDTCVWVVGRHEIDYILPIRPGDKVTGVTWVETPERSRCPRHVWLVNPDTGVVYAKALTQWWLVDPATQRPRRVPPEVSALFEPWMAV